MPVVTQTTERSGERPVAKALGSAVSAIATRGLGMSARAQSRSIMPCSSGACSGVTSRARMARMRDRVGAVPLEERDADAADADQQATSPGLLHGEHQSDDDRDEHAAEQEHDGGHPDGESGVGDEAGTCHDW